MSLASELTAVADKIRQKTSYPDKMRISEMPILIEDTYTFGKEDGYNEGHDAGYTDGFAEGKERGIEQGIEQGKQAEYDAIWDGIQMNGERSNYIYGFSNAWTKETFKPKYSVITNSGTTVANNTFYLFNNNLAEDEIDEKAIDLAEVAEERGIVFDFTNARQMTQTFETGGIKRIGVLDLTKKTSLVSTFAQRAPYSLSQIDKIISSATTPWSDTGIFRSCIRLTRCIFEGVIASKLTMSDCDKLDRQSINSIFGCLSPTTSGLSVTLAKGAVNKAFETSEGANDGSTSKEWLDLVSAYDNWTISLA